VSNFPQQSAAETGLALDFSSKLERHVRCDQSKSKNSEELRSAAAVRGTKPKARQSVWICANSEEAIMKVKEVMTPDAKAIWITESLADAAKEMWENDCGALPIIKDGRKVVGMITDRDICMAAAMRDRNPSAVSVEEVMNRVVYAAEAEDDIEQALQTMREHKVRRLPVLNLEGELQGIVSMNDIVLKAKGNGKKPKIDYGDVVKTYQAICEHPLPMVQAVTAT
jgi:CBS-domain-containing membrane protein